MSAVMGRSVMRRGALLLFVVAALVAIGRVALAQGAGSSDSQLDPHWVAQQVAQADPPTGVKDNLVQGAIARRDEAVRNWQLAVTRYNTAAARARSARGATQNALSRAAAKLAPDPFAKPEYV